MDISETFPALLCGISAFSAFLVVHILMWRVPGHKGKSFPAIIVVAILAYAACSLSVIRDLPAGETVASFAVSFSLYVLLMALYADFYAGILRSVSVRILGELVNSPGGRLTLSELDRLYPKRGMVEERISLMAQNGWLAESGGKYECSPKGAKASGVAIFLAKVYGMEITG